MLLSAHESAAGGVDKVFERAARDRAESIQLWTRSSRQWASKPLGEGEVRAFKAEHERHGGKQLPLAAHAAYLINLASSKPDIRARSVATLIEECQRAEQLGVGQVIVHVGAAKDESRSSAISRVGAARRGARCARHCRRRHACASCSSSKSALGSRVDRHQVIGEGLIGVAPFARLVCDERFASLPGYLETPPLASGEESYALGLSRLRALL